MSVAASNTRSTLVARVELNVQGWELSLLIVTFINPCIATASLNYGHLSLIQDPLTL